ncbi:HAD hydrolase-like protein [Microlunatus phosphovorus]|uniref:HAD hydrolase-like protein n=1 Tax=Microlunatus phosphovorus TaxID=29405 RepID=UPI000A032EFF
MGDLEQSPRRSPRTAAADSFGVASTHCVYVGDSHEFDVAAAAAAGMHPIYVGPKAPAVEVPSFPELRRLHEHLISGRS